MSLTLEDATTALRDQILRGNYVPGAKLREVSVAESLGVSRTIARLAMSALEHKGLLTREPNRGSRVRPFAIEQIADAIEVRGELEAMAVRLAAERGLSGNALNELNGLITRSEILLEAGVRDDDQRSEWIAINQQFHDCLIDAAQNWALKIAINQMSNLPLVSAKAIIFDRKDNAKGLAQLRAAHYDHCEILAAVTQRQGHRAEARMREHAYANAQNKRVNLTDPETMMLARELPGGPLIASKGN